MYRWAFINVLQEVTLTNPDELTDSIEDYLKAIHKVQKESDAVSTSELAEHLDISPASVSGMTKKMADMNLVEHKPYEGVSLTEHGEKIALEVVRHHRLIERFLTEALDISWDQVHEEAERLEHVISEELEDRMEEFLDHPDTDPHGSPIPSREGTIERPPSKPLSEMDAGESALIYEVSDHDSDLLRYLAQKNLFPGTKVTYISEEPYSGGVNLEANGQNITIGSEAASYIQVTDESNF